MAISIKKPFFKKVGGVPAPTQEDYLEMTKKVIDNHGGEDENTRTQIGTAQEDNSRDLVVPIPPVPSPPPYNVPQPQPIVEQPQPEPQPVVEKPKEDDMEEIEKLRLAVEKLDDMTDQITEAQLQVRRLIRYVKEIIK